MNLLNLNDVVGYVEEHIGIFHNKKLTKLSELKLKKVLKRKNPYLFKAKNILTAHDLVKGVLDAYLLSQEETIFGNFLEGVAIFVCEKVFGGKKTDIIGMDLEFERDNIVYIVSIKSGPNWGNSDQINRMKNNFINAKTLLRTKLSATTIEIIAVNGCCYGIDNKPEKKGYLKLCGQRFWEFISSNRDLYIDIIEPLGHKAKQKNEEFIEAYAQIINEFTFEFGKDFCDDGKINWEKLVKFNSQNNL